MRLFPILIASLLASGCHGFPFGSGGSGGGHHFREHRSPTLAAGPAGSTWVVYGVLWDNPPDEPVYRVVRMTDWQPYNTDDPERMGEDIAVNALGPARLAFGSDGTPVLGFIGFSQDKSESWVELHRFDGQHWTQLGTWRPPRPDGAPVRFLESRTDRNLVTWTVWSAAPGKLRVGRTGAGDMLEQAGEDLLLAPGQSIQRARLLLTPAGQPVVVHDVFDTYAGGRISVRALRWTGTEWQRLGGDLGPFGRGEGWDAALDVAGRPVVVHPLGTDLTVARWTGTEWSTFPAVIQSGRDNLTNEPRVAVDSLDRPSVYYTYQYLYEYGTKHPYPAAVRWNGSGWEGQDAPVGYFEERADHDLAVDSNDELVMAHVNMDVGIGVMVRRRLDTRGLIYKQLP